MDGLDLFTRFNGYNYGWLGLSPAMGDLGFGDSCSSILLLFSLSISRSPHLSRVECTGCCELLCVEVSFITGE